jgi:O-antigen ligase
MQTAQIHELKTDRHPLDAALVVLATAAVALAPTQVTIAVKGIPLHPAEPLLAVAALLWAVRWLRVRDTGSLPPLSHWLVLAAGAFSIFALLTDAVPEGGRNVLHLGGIYLDTVALKGWLTETAQTVLYLLAAVTIFRAVLTDPARLRRALILLLATTTLAVAFGVAQRVMLSAQYTPDAFQRKVEIHSYLTVQTPIAVSAAFGSWNEHGYHPSRIAYAGFLALVLPFALTLMLTDRRLGVRIWLGLLFAGAALSVLAGLVAPIILLGLLVTGIALGPRAGRGVLVGIVAYTVFTLAAGPLQRGEVLLAPYKPVIDARDAARFYPDTHTRHLKKIWGEQQAALNLFRHHPLLGVGSGQYQAKINPAYDMLSALTTQRLEPDAQNGYLLTLATTGIIGLAALLALLGGYLGLARARLRAGAPWAAALLGSTVALAALLLVSNPWMRGTSIVIALIFAVLGTGATSAAGMRITTQEEPPC